MILTIKLTSIAFNLRDGTMRKADIDAAIAKNNSRTAREQQHLSISYMPDPIEFLGWVYNPITFFAGPALEIREYLRATNEGYPSVVGRTDHVHQDSSNPFLNRIFMSLFKLIFGLVFMGVTAVGMAKFSNMQSWESINEWFPIDPAGTPLKEVAMNTIHRFGAIWIWMMFTRPRYYGAWYLAEGATIMAGYGYENAEARALFNKPETGLLPVEWSGNNQVDVVHTELAMSISQVTRAWNQSTQRWLERYIYKRLPRTMNINLVTLYFVSAFWHGFYPGYYVFFMTVPFATVIERHARHKIRPLFFDSEGNARATKILYDVATWFLTLFMLNYLGIMFQMLAIDRGWAVWRSLSFFGHFLLLMGFVIVFLPKPATSRGRGTEGKKDL
jgi:hypothetical protein